MTKKREERRESVLSLRGRGLAAGLQEIAGEASRIWKQTRRCTAMTRGRRGHA